MTTENKPHVETKKPMAAICPPAGPFAAFADYTGPVIPVKVLVRLHTSTQVPGKQQDDTIKTETMGNGRSWTIHYLPGLRHHRITFFDNIRKETKVVMLHETHVNTWEPLNPSGA